MRKKFEQDPNSPYHVTNRYHNRDQFPVPQDEAWRIFEDYLNLIVVAYSVKIHAFVMMPNHYHLVVSAPLGNLSESIAYLNREVTREMNRLANKINQCFGARFFRSRIGDDHYFKQAYKYTYFNPVRANLSKRVEDYPYSTFGGLIGVRRLVIPIAYDFILFDDFGFNRTLEWLNQEAAPEEWQRVRKAIRKRDFCFRRLNNYLDPLASALL